MSSYRQIFYHIVFSTKFREKTLNLNHSEELYKYIWGIVKNKKSVLYRINGMEEHLHLLCDLHPSISLADFVREINVASSGWLKKNPNFPEFKSCGLGYGTFTISSKEKDRVLTYIKYQRQHHQKQEFPEEYLQLLEENNVQVDARYFLND